MEMPALVSRFLVLISLIAPASIAGARPPTEPILPGDITVRLEPFVFFPSAQTSFVQEIVSANDDSSRLFAARRNGIVEIVRPDGTISPTPFLNVADAGLTIYTSGEGGFSGMAFSPSYSTDRKFYTFTTEPYSESNSVDFSHPEIAPAVPKREPTNHIAIREWTTSANPNVANTTSRLMMRINHPGPHHQGGGLRFGNDGMLYISLGDGSAVTGINTPDDGHTDTISNAQDTSVVFGKILRIDPKGTNSANGQYGIPASNPFVGQVNKVQEIFAYGFRNPYRIGFDSVTGDLFTGDVGSAEREEVDKVVSGGNFGWRYREGTRDNVDFPYPPPPGFTSIDPIGEYTHSDGRAVVGGVVYRGSLLPQLYGKYVFADFAAGDEFVGRLFYMDAAGGTISEFQYDLTGGGVIPQSQIVTIGEDQSHELYVMIGNDLIRIVPEPTSAAAFAIALVLCARRRRALFAHGV